MKLKWSSVWIGLKQNKVVCKESISYLDCKVDQSPVSLETKKWRYMWYVVSEITYLKLSIQIGYQGCFSVSKRLRSFRENWDVFHSYRYNFKPQMILGKGFFQWVRKQSWFKEGIMILYNCSMALEKYCFPLTLHFGSFLELERKTLRIQDPSKPLSVAVALACWMAGQIVTFSIWVHCYILIPFFHFQSSSSVSHCQSLTRTQLARKSGKSSFQACCPDIQSKEMKWSWEPRGKTTHRI